MNSAKVIKLPSHSNMHHFAEAENGREHTWFWRKKVDGCADLLCWFHDSREEKVDCDACLLCWFPSSIERRLMVVLTYFASFVILEKEKSMVIQASSTGFLLLEKVKPMVVLTSSAVFFVLEKREPMVTYLPCWFRVLFVFSPVLLTPSTSLCFSPLFPFSFSFSLSVFLPFVFFSFCFYKARESPMLVMADLIIAVRHAL